MFQRVRQVVNVAKVVFCCAVIPYGMCVVDKIGVHGWYGGCLESKRGVGIGDFDLVSVI